MHCLSVLILSLVVAAAVAKRGYGRENKIEARGHRRDYNDEDDKAGYMNRVDRRYLTGDKGAYENRVDDYRQYNRKYECRKNSDCIKGYICSDNYCVPDCGPCSEFDFTIGKCRYECARNAKCVKRGRNNYKCFCQYCPGMDGYNKVANCIPPKFLRGICYSYDPLSKAPAPKHVRDYYRHKDGKKDNLSYGPDGYI